MMPRSSRSQAPRRLGASSAVPSRPPRVRGRRPSLLVPLAGAFLVVFALVTGWRLVGELAEAARGLTYARPRSSELRTPAAELDPALQQAILETTAGFSGELSFVVRDLRGGRYASADPDKIFPSASLFKLPILVASLQQIELGRLKRDTRLTVRQEHWTDGSGVLQARVGEQLTVDQLMDLMITESDNIAALVLLDAIGAEEVNSTARAMGLRDTRLLDRRVERTGDHATSASDMALLLETLATGKLINDNVSDEALKLLERRQVNSWLADGLPWWVKLAHKWGDLAGTRHDAGVVYAPRATYVVVVLTRGGEPRDAQQRIAEVSRVAFEHFGG